MKYRRRQQCLKCGSLIYFRRTSRNHRKNIIQGGKLSDKIKEYLV
jgi:hypothetical protein